MKKEEIANRIISFIVNNKLSDYLIIEEQFKNSSFEIVEDNVGFNIYYSDYKGKHKTSRLDYEINTVGGRMDDIDVGFTIYIRDGKLDEIEGYTYGGINFPLSSKLDLFKLN